MSTPVITPSADPQVQTTPTPAGMPAPVPPAPTPVAAPVAPVTPAAPTPAATPTPYATEDLGNGRVRVKFADLPEVYEGTQAEILPKIAEALYNTKKYAQTLKQTPPAAPAPPVVTPPTSSRFADTVEEQAANQLADLVAKRFGYENGDALQKALGHTVNTADDYQSNQLSISFQAAQPDFNGIPENVAKLASTIGMFVGSDEAWAQMQPAQQLNAMRAAHAYNLQNKIYEPRPAQAAPPPNVPIPPPPVPTAKSPQDQFSGVPADMIPTINDTQAVILEKTAKLRAAGYIQ